MAREVVDAWFAREAESRRRESASLADERAQIDARLRVISERSEVLSQELDALAAAERAWKERPGV